MEALFYWYEVQKTQLHPVILESPPSPSPKTLAVIPRDTLQTLTDRHKTTEKPTLRQN